MKIQALPLLLLLALLSFPSCKKKEAKPREALPAATMEGKNTFGAMVNDKVWLPKGIPSTFQPNYQLFYDPGYHGGSISIRVYRKVKSDFYELLVIFMTQVDHTGIYDLGNRQLGRVFYKSEACEYEGDVEGTLEITKLDLQKGIVAGKFEFTLVEPNCNTIHVTEGRFDKKLF